MITPISRAPERAGVMTACGPVLTTWALQQVVGYLEYTGRAADVVVTAANDPTET